MGLAQGHTESTWWGWELQSSCLALGLLLDDPHTELLSFCFKHLIFPGEN